MIQEAKSAELAISRVSKNQTRPSIASSGTNYLVAWYSKHNLSLTGIDIWGRIISIDGALQDSFPICTLLQNQIFPKVAWGNNKYLVTWMLSNTKLDEIYGQFIDINGNFIDTAFLILDNLDLSVGSGNDIESNGTNFLVVSTKNGGTSNLDIVGRIVKDTDSFAGAAFNVCNIADTQFFPKTVSINKNYLVAWPDFRTGTWNTYGQKISKSGAFIGGNFSIASKSDPQRRIALASNDSCVLVAWEEDHGMFVGWDIQGSIFDTAMNILHSDFTICMGMWDQRLPCACWHSKTSKFIVGWHDYRVSPANIWIRKVTDNKVFDSEEKITTLPIEQREPDIASSSKCFLVVWEDYRQSSTDINIYGYIPNCTGKEENIHIMKKLEKIKSYPNPFVDFVKFIGVKEEIRIYDIRGRFVKELKANQVWYGRNANNVEVPSGTYFVHPIRSSLPIQKIIKL